MKWLHKTAVGLFAVFALAGCAGVGIGGDHIRWTEEVKLSDGRVIQIQRHVEKAGSGFPVDKRGASKYHEICYPPLGIHWKSRGGYLPDIFDIVDGKAYMHVPISDCFSCERYGYPTTNAIYFVWEQDRWQRIEREAFPERSEWNLLRQISSGTTGNDPKGLITLADKAIRDRESRYEQGRLGWKRISERAAWNGVCDKCRNVKTRNYGNDQSFLEILISNTPITCQQ